MQAALYPDRAIESRRRGAVGPGADAHAVAGAIAEYPVRRGAGFVHYTSSCGQRRLHTLLHVFASDRHVYVHGVPQRLGLVQILQPDRRTVAQPIDSVVFGQRRVPQGGAPEANIAIVGLRRDGVLDLLRGRPVGGGPMPACDRRDVPRQVERCRRSSRQMPRVSRTVRRSSAIVISAPERSRPGTCATAAASCAASPSDGTPNTADAPPCSTTQSSTPSAARNCRHPCSLIYASHAET